MSRSNRQSIPAWEKRGVRERRSVARCSWVSGVAVLHDRNDARLLDISVCGCALVSPQGSLRNGETTTMQILFPDRELQLRDVNCEVRGEQLFARSSSPFFCDMFRYGILFTGLDSIDREVLRLLVSTSQAASARTW